MSRAGNSLGPLPLLHCCRKRKKAQQVRVEFPAEPTDGSVHIRRHAEVSHCLKQIADRVPHADLTLTSAAQENVTFFLSLSLQCLVCGCSWFDSLPPLPQADMSLQQRTDTLKHLCSSFLLFPIQTHTCWKTKLSINPHTERESCPEGRGEARKRAGGGGGEGGEGRW